MDENVRAVNVNEIVKQRSNDIILAFQAFKNGRSTRTPMQRLPRHMRRRAMSHNVKRMPKNWRQFSIQTTKKSKHRKKPPSRYYRRRRRFQGGNDPSILRTHIWHAKRYHMKKIVGANFTLPHKCFQKVQRTCLRAAAKGCCAADHSYWETFTIETMNKENDIIQHIMDYCRLKSLPKFENNKCHDLILYKTKSNERMANDCFGPVQIRKMEDIGKKYFEFSADIRSNLLQHFQASNLNFEKISQTRITLYGPKALERIIEAFNISKSKDDDNPFNDVLDGAVLLKGYWFRLKGFLSKEKEFFFDLIYRLQAPESIIDIVCDKSIQKDVWIKLIHCRCQPLGITDEQNVKIFYGKFSFPDDFPDFVNPFILPLETKELQDQHNRRPRNRRVKYETLSSDNPFNFEFDKIVKDPTDLVPVKIIPIGKGVPQRYSFIYSKIVEAEKEDDIEMVNDDDEDVAVSPPPRKRLALDEDFIPLITMSASKFSKIVPMSRLFEVEIKPKLSRGMKRRAKKKAEKRGEIVANKNEEESIEEKSKEFRIPQGTVIGRIVRGLRWTSRHGNKLGFGYCSYSALKPILENNSIIYFRNPASHKYRKARITVIPFDARF